MCVCVCVFLHFDLKLITNAGNLKSQKESKDPALNFTADPFRTLKLVFKKRGGGGGRDNSYRAQIILNTKTQ